jgi:hypothetical protein
MNAQTNRASSIVAASRRLLLAGCAGGVTASLLPARSAHAAASIALRSVPKDPPPARRVIFVPETYPSIRAALAAAQPGDHISLADGTYPRDRVWSLAAVTPPYRYVVVRARNRHKAVFTGRVTLASPGLWLHGLATKFMSAEDESNTDDYSIKIQASRIRVTRCLIRSLGGIRIYSQKPEHRDIILSYNDFSVDRPHRYNDSQLLIGDVAKDSAGPTDVDVAYNRFSDTAPDLRVLPDGSTAPVNGRHAIYLGHSKPGTNPTGVNLSIRIHHNAVLGHRPHAIYIKRHVYIGFNYVQTSDRATKFPQLGFRHGGGPVGSGGIIEGNFVDGNGINVNDTGARVLGNHAPFGAIRLHSGTGTWDARSSKYINLYQAASDCILVGNRALYRVGYSLPGILVRYLLASEGAAVRGVRIHMAGKGQPSDVLREPPIPADRGNPGVLAEPYIKDSILIDAATSGGHSFPAAAGQELLGQVGSGVP